MLEGSGDDSFQLAVEGVSDHGVSFPAAGLAVGKHGSVIALGHVFDKVEAGLLVYRQLGRISAENIVVGEGLGELLVLGVA